VGAGGDQGDQCWEDGEPVHRLTVQCPPTIRYPFRRRLDEFKNGPGLELDPKNFLLCGRLKISFIPGLNNSTADALPRWTGLPPEGIKVTQVIAAEDRIKTVHREGHWGIEGTLFRLRERGIKAPEEVIRSVVRRCGGLRPLPEPPI